MLLLAKCLYDRRAADVSHSHGHLVTHRCVHRELIQLPQKRNSLRYCEGLDLVTMHLETGEGQTQQKYRRALGDTKSRRTDESGCRQQRGSHSKRRVHRVPGPGLPGAPQWQQLPSSCLHSCLMLPRCSCHEPTQIAVTFAFQCHEPVPVSSWKCETVDSGPSAALRRRSAADWTLLPLLFSMPVGIAPQKQKEKGAGRNGSLVGSFAASLSSSVGVYSKTTRSSHSFRLREPDSPGRGAGRPPSRQSRAATPKFNEKERAVIANLDQLSPEVPIHRIIVTQRMCGQSPDMILGTRRRSWMTSTKGCMLLA